MSKYSTFRAGKDSKMT